MTFDWWLTPRGVMRYIGPVPGKEPTSAYRDKEGRERFFHDVDCKPTKEPTWYKRQSKGISARDAKKQAREARQKAVAV